MNPDLPPQFERILERSLEKDRDLRYQSAAEMRAEMKILKRTLDSQRTAAAHDTAGFGSGSSVAAPPAIPPVPLKIHWTGAFAPMPIVAAVSALLAGLAIGWFVHAARKPHGSAATTIS